MSGKASPLLENKAIRRPDFTRLHGLDEGIVPVWPEAFGLARHAKQGVSAQALHDAAQLRRTPNTAIRQEQDFAVFG